jgi:hypothetical protein
MGSEQMGLIAVGGDCSVAMSPDAPYAAPKRAAARAVGAINAPTIHRIGKKKPMKNSQ